MTKQMDLSAVYDRLIAHFGPQDWWPADSPFEVMVGAVLVQATSWSNVERAIENLKAACAMSPAAIRQLPVPELECLIHPSGFFRPKARRLRVTVRVPARPTRRRHRLDVRKVDARPATGTARGPRRRDRRLPTTFCCTRWERPVFVVDAYTRRVFHRLGVIDPDAPYHQIQETFHCGLPQSVSLYNEYHALIVRLAASTCRVRPVCGECPLDSLCPKLDV